MVCGERFAELFAEDWSEERDGHVLRELLGCLHSLWKSCRGMGKKRIADLLVNHNPRIRVGGSLAYLTFDPCPLREDEDGLPKLAVRGVAYEPVWVTSSEELTRAS